jgi:hypothetical protein
MRSIPGTITEYGIEQRLANERAARESTTSDDFGIIEALRKVKQDEFNSAVEGSPRQPADVVDSVVYAITDYLPEDIKARLYAEVLSFYPDYDA